MADYARQLNPEVASIVNINNLRGTNKAFINSIYHDRILPHTDLYFVEGSNAASVTDDGRLLSNIRDYKIARIFSNMALNWRGSPGGAGYTPITVPEALAFNPNGALCPATMKDENIKYVDFLHRHFEHYKEATNIADVAVLRSFASMAYNNFTTHQSTILLEQTLIQTKIPFDIIFDSHLKDLSKYKVLVLANQESLSDEQVALIRDFVHQGGGLVATELSSLYDEWRRRRSTFGLIDLFDVSPPPTAARGRLPKLTKDVRKKKLYGKGRVVYLTSVEPSIKRPDNAWMTNRYWALPVNWQELVDAITWADAESLSVEVRAPLTVAAEFQEQKELNKTIIHLVNYNAVKDPVVSNISVRVRLTNAEEIEAVIQLSPKTDEEIKLPFRVRDGSVVFTVHRLQTYCMVVIK